MGKYYWETFKEADERINNIAKGMLGLGLVPGKDKIVIFSETQAEWMLVLQASFKSNIIVTTLYATLGEEAILHGINESEVIISTYLFHYYVMNTIPQIIPMSVLLNMIKFV